MPLSPGDRLDDFEILAAIGKGGMGEVFKARDTAIHVSPSALPHHVRIAKRHIRIGLDTEVELIPVVTADELKAGLGAMDWSGVNAEGIRVPLAGLATPSRAAPPVRARLLHARSPAV